MASPALKPPFPPRWEDLTEVAELTASQVPDDALVSGIAASAAALEWHTVEFAELGASTIAGGTFAHGIWHRPSWYDLRISASDLANLQLTEAGLRRCEFVDCRLTGFELSTAVIQDVTFTSCLLDLSSFRFAKLTRVRFVDCSLRSVDLASAVLTDVTFTGCNLSEAQFHDLRTTRGRLEGCSLTGAKSITGLRGMRIDPLDLIELSHQLAAELGIIIASSQDN